MTSHSGLVQRLRFRLKGRWYVSSDRFHPFSLEDPTVSVTLSEVRDFR